MHKKVAIVGKRLTFDSGGYNLKAGAGSMIEMMKFDMGGSAATLGAAKIVGMMEPEGVEAHFIIASCENMVSADAFRPGDILTASNGKTIEVGNTDAEGRSCGSFFRSMPTANAEGHDGSEGSIGKVSGEARLWVP